MLKSILVLPDGRELSSGADALYPLMWVKLTESVNEQEELTMGGVFANILEAKIHTYRKSLELTVGEEVILYKEDDSGVRHRIGIFVVDKPTCPTPDTMELRGFDRIIKLNRDLTGWLKSLDGWPYRLMDFAGMVCDACGLELVTDTIPNGDFLVQPFSAEVTGYQLMRWIGEACCRFCRANADGKIELGWYTPADVSITPSGDCYYLQNSLSYAEYEVAPVDAVQIRLADDESGALWPQVEDGSNSYIIDWNPILLSGVSEDLLPVLENIRQALPGVPYRPFRVSIPTVLDIHAGNMVRITDKNGVAFTSLVMTREQSGQKDTLECTGSPRRDSVTFQNNRTKQENNAELKSYADRIAQSKVDAQTQTDIFNKLTDNGKMEGLYMRDGQLYINASYIKSGSIVSEDTAYLPPTHDDVMTMLWSLSFPDRYPPKDFYDLNGDGIFNRDDVILAKDVYFGKRQIYTCPGAYKTDVTVTIAPSTPQRAVLISGINMWGSEVSVYLGTGGTSIPTIAGDCSVGGKLAVGDYAILHSLSTDVDQEPKKLSWKEMNGVKILIGYEGEEPDVQSVTTLYSGTLDRDSVSLAGGYSRYVIVGYTTQNKCKMSMTIPAAACDGSLFQLYADGAWVSFNMSVNALTISKVSNGGAITGIYGIL